MAKFKVGDKVKIRYDNSVGFIIKEPEGEELRYWVRHKDSQGRFPQDYFEEFELKETGFLSGEKEPDAGNY